MTRADTKYTAIVAAHGRGINVPLAQCTPGAGPVAQLVGCPAPDPGQLAASAACALPNHVCTTDGAQHACQDEDEYDNELDDNAEDDDTTVTTGRQRRVPSRFGHEE